MTQVASFIKKRTVLLSTVALLALAGAGVGLSGPSAKAAPVAPQVVSVGVKTMGEQDVRLWSAFSGRLHAVDFAEIRPEVSGRVMEVRFKDGQTVKTGDILYVIDPRPFEAAVAKANANLASSKTNAAFAKTEFERAENLVKTRAIAQRVYDERANADRMAQAAVSVAQAEVKQAYIDLDHAYVKAPITGRVSRAEITVGNLVQAGAGAPVLTSIVSNDGIYADFEVDEQTFMKSIRSHTNTQAKEQEIPVELTVQGDEAHPYKGTVHSFDNRIDTGTGTIRARAKFANEDGSLMPGMFVAVKLASSSDSTALLVPDRAIGNDQSKKFVFIVTPDNKVAYREVVLGEQIIGQRIVLSGLQSGDRVIVDGLQHIKPDLTVQATEVVANRAGDGTSKLAAN